MNNPDEIKKIQDKFPMIAKYGMTQIIDVFITNHGPMYCFKAEAIEDFLQTIDNNMNLLKHTVVDATKRNLRVE